MEKILISACLLGHKVRFDGRHNDCRSSSLITTWLNEGRLILVCPEVAGGLSVPRPPAMIVGHGGGYAVHDNQAKVITNEKIDVTDAFLNGAKYALEITTTHNIKIAILKNRSPSCGSSHIYDNIESKNIIEGVGVTTALLKKNGITIFHEEQILEAAEYLEKLEKRKSP